MCMISVTLILTLSTKKAHGYTTKNVVAELKITDYQTVYGEFNVKICDEIKGRIEEARYNSLKIKVNTSADTAIRKESEVSPSNVFKEVSKGTEVEIINKIINGEWYKLVDESQGALYIHKNYVYANDTSNVNSSYVNQLSRGSYNGSSYKAYTDGFNVYTPSGITVEELYGRLSSEYPGVKHLADDAIAIEKQYGINAIFTMSVAIHESGNGDSSLASAGNYFGIKGGNPWYKPGGDGSKSVYRFAEVINDISSYKGKQIRGINVAYCPDDGHWSRTVVKIMNSF